MWGSRGLEGEQGMTGWILRKNEFATRKMTETLVRVNLHCLKTIRRTLKMSS